MSSNKKLFYVFSIDRQLLSHRTEVVRAAAAAGYDVTVVAQDTGSRAEVEALGAKFIDLPINRVGTNPLEELKTLRFLRKLYRQHRPDIVHHISLKVVLWGSIAARMAKVKGVVNAVNGLGVFFADGKADSAVKKVLVRLMRYGHNRGKLITIFQNKDDKAFFTDNRILKEEQTYMIKGSGVDVEKFCYCPPRPKDKLEIVFTARMVEDKGIFDIIKAAEILRPKYGDKVVFKLYGGLETNPRAVSAEVLREVCDDNYIVYKGFERDIKTVLENSDLVVLPSYYREGLPKSLIDAAAVGRPIVTTDWTGCREAVDDGVNGYLVPVRSPEKLAEKIDLLLQDRELRERMGRESRRLAETDFSLSEVINHHFKVYEMLG